ncbi:MAG TPA: metal-dependent transcriptional regulator [Thermoanaerobaculia bacterium]|nr:metal-dependent transcriptional regulator [Thermoanaerobaculia bacterium]
MSRNRRHDVDLADQDLEEVAEELWNLHEGGSESLSDLKGVSSVVAVDAAVDLLCRRGMAEVRGDRVILTPAGRALGGRQVRRNRLGETLLTTVLEVTDERAVERTACVMEHVLDAAITDSICAFLGHPAFCPHGKPIPRGACCEASTRTIEPLVRPLAELPVGQEGRIVYIAAKDPERLMRLSHLGVVPGAAVRLTQSRPAAILRIGETVLAVEPEIAGEIYVKRVG